MSPPQEPLGAVRQNYSKGEQDGVMMRPDLVEEQSTIMTKRDREWTNLKSPATSVGVALQERVVGDYNKKLERGISVTKVTTRGALKERILTVSKDKFAIFITHRRIQFGRAVVSGIATKLPLPIITRKGGILGFTNQQQLREQFVRYIDVADLDYIQCGVVATQKLEQSRKRNRLKGLNSKVDDVRGSIVTIGHHGFDTLDLFVYDEHDRNALVQCIRAMKQTYHEAKSFVDNEALLLRYIWYDIDLNRDGKISSKEFCKILHRINISLPNPVKSYEDFVKSRGITQPTISYAEAVALLQEVKKKTGNAMADMLWDQIFGSDRDVVDARDFLTRFLHMGQSETYTTLDDVRVLLSMINSMELNDMDEPKITEQNNQISRARFETFLYHEVNNAYDPWALERDVDIALDKPMSEYWINTSHNTYLTGDQLQSPSSVEMYMRALRRGCKCVEIDCWDGEKSKGGEYLPVVYHGHTLTSKILFEDVIKCVKAYITDHPNTYPIILSLENHCSRPFEDAMAKILKSVLQNILYVPTIEDTKGGDLPSPERLCGKVVIKGKRPPDPDEDTTEQQHQGDGDDDPSIRSPVSPNSSRSSPKSESDVNTELARLTLFHGTKFKNFEKSLVEPFNHMHSINEGKVIKMVCKNQMNTGLWREYNRRHMTRIYPAGARVDSSNYNPLLAWSMGCQMVALNFQTADSPLVVNYGLFQQNGNCGYLEKPPNAMKDMSVTSQASIPAATTPDHHPVAKEEDDALLLQQDPNHAGNDNEDTLDKVMGGLESLVCACGVTDIGNDVASLLTPWEYNNNNGQSKSLLSSVTPIQMLRSTTFSQNRVLGTGALEEQRQLQQSANSSNNNVATTNNKHVPMKLKVRILSGSCLPKPMGNKLGETIDPYVIVTVHDIVVDEKKNTTNSTIHYNSTSHTTNTIQNNGFCPVWNESIATEFIVHSPWIAMIQFRLVETDVGLDDHIAECVIPIHCIRLGYRSIHLYDHNNTRSGSFGFATLLVELQMIHSS